MVKKTLFTLAAASATAVDAACPMYEEEFASMATAFQKHMKTACNIDVTADVCLDAQIDASTGRIFDFAVRDSRGREFVATSHTSFTSDEPILTFPGPSECNGDLECAEEFLCTGELPIGASLMTSTVSLPKRNGGVLYDDEIKAAAAEYRENKDLLRSTPENIIAERMNIVHQYLLQTVPSFNEMPAEIAAREDEEGIALQEQIKAERLENYMQHVLDVDYEYIMDDITGRVTRKKVQDIVLRGDETSASAEETPSLRELLEAFGEEYRATQTSSRLTSGNMYNLRRTFDNIANNWQEGSFRFNDRYILAQVNSVLPKNFDPRVDKRDSSLPDTRACFAVENIKDQGQCGSCWAHAAATEAYNHACVRNGGPIKSSSGALMNLSTQALMDCGAGRGDPCGGGFMTNNIRSWPLDAEYPYTKRCNSPQNQQFFHKVVPQNKRQAECYKIKQNISSDAWPCECAPPASSGKEYCYSSRLNDRVRTTDTAARQSVKDDMPYKNAYMKGLIYFNGGVRISMKVHSGFYKYVRDPKMAGKAFGTDTYLYPPNEWARRTDIGHAIVAVGWGYDETARKEFWIIQNSWGTDNTDNGFDRIYMDDPVLASTDDYTFLQFSHHTSLYNKSYAPSQAKPPQRVTANLQQIQFNPGLANKLFVHINCDTPTCGVFANQKYDGVGAGIYLHENALQPRFRKQGGYERYMYIDSRAFTSSPKKDTMLVGVYSHIAKVVYTEVRFPEELVNHYNTIVQVNNDLHRAGMERDNPQTLDLGRWCRDANAMAKIRNLDHLCRIANNFRM